MNEGLRRMCPPICKPRASMMKFGKAGRQVVRLVERIHVKVMSGPADVVHEDRERMVPKSCSTAIDLVDTSSQNSRSGSHQS